jgi:predicted nucleic acid-binding protein
MILVDTSVIVDYLRTRDNRLLGLFVQHDGAICGVIRAEVLHGRRDAAHRQQLVNALNAFHQLPTPEAIWDEVGANLAALRAAGVTVPFADAVITTVAITNGIELWTRDAHFTRIQAVLPALVLFQEPP